METEAAGNQPPAASRQRTIITHAVMVGLTPLIPVPLLDDLVKNYFQRRLVRGLAAAHGRQLSAEDVEVLGADRGGGCLMGGCAGSLLFYPLKKVFRKVFYFLEWKRAADLTSQAYHHGYLVDFYLAELWGAAGARDARAVRDAIDAVCRETPIRPLESAVGGTFRGSKKVLAGGAALLERSLRRGGGRADEREVARAVEAVEAEEEREIESVVSRLQRAIDAIPDTHFRQMRERLSARLGEPAR